MLYTRIGAHSALSLLLGLINGKGTYPGTLLYFSSVYWASSSGILF